MNLTKRYELHRVELAGPPGTARTTPSQLCRGDAMPGAAAGPDGPGPHGQQPRIPPQGGALAKVLELAHRRGHRSVLPLTPPPPVRPQSPQERLAVQAEAVFNHHELSLTDPETLRALEAALHLVTLILDADAAPAAGRLREEEHRHLTDQLAALLAAAASL